MGKPGTDILREVPPEIAVEIPDLFRHVVGADGALALDADGKPVKAPVTASMRILSVPEETACRKHAREYAEAAGAPQAPGDPDWEIGFRACAVSIAFRKADGDDKGQPFWADAATVIQEAGSGAIFWLYQRLRVHQSRYSPFTHELSGAEYMALLEKEVSSSDDGPFSGLSPYTQWHCWHIAAVAIANSPEAKSSLGLLLLGEAANSSGSTTSETPKATPSAPPP